MSRPTPQHPRWANAMAGVVLSLVLSACGIALEPGAAGTTTTTAQFMPGQQGGAASPPQTSAPSLAPDPFVDPESEEGGNSFGPPAEAIVLTDDVDRLPPQCQAQIAAFESVFHLADIQVNELFDQEVFAQALEDAASVFDATVPSQPPIVSDLMTSLITDLREAADEVAAAETITVASDAYNRRLAEAQPEVLKLMDEALLVCPDVAIG